MKIIYYILAFILTVFGVTSILLGHPITESLLFLVFGNTYGLKGDLSESN